MDIEQLISEVFSRPALWDQKNKCHHNRVLVEKLWIAVAKEMKVSKEDVKKKWKYLRDNFRSELRKIPVPKSGDAGDASRNDYSWPYFKSLLFLKDQMQYRNLSGNLKPKKGKGDQAVVVLDYEENNEDVSPTEIIDNTFDSFESYSEVPRKKQSAQNNASQLVEIEKRKLELLEKKTAEKKTVVDEDEAFFLSLLPHIRKLDPKDKFLWRMDVQNDLFKYVYGKTTNLPQMSNESSRYAALSSPVSTSSNMDNGHFLDLSTNNHFQPIAIASNQLLNSNLYTQSVNIPPTSSPFNHTQSVNIPPTSSPLHLSQSVNIPPTSSPFNHTQSVNIPPTSSPLHLSQSVNIPPTSSPFNHTQSVNIPPTSSPLHLSQSVNIPPTSSPFHHTQTVNMPSTSSPFHHTKFQNVPTTYAPFHHTQIRNIPANYSSSDSMNENL